MLFLYFSLFTFILLTFLFLCSFSQFAIIFYFLAISLFFGYWINLYRESLRDISSPSKFCFFPLLIEPTCFQNSFFHFLSFTVSFNTLHTFHQTCFANHSHFFRFIVDADCQFFPVVVKDHKSYLNIHKVFIL